MLRDQSFVSGEVEIPALPPAKENAARDFAEFILQAGIRNVGNDMLVARSGYEIGSQELNLFKMRVRTRLERGFKHMVKAGIKGLRVLTEGERAAEIARRAKQGAKKIYRAKAAADATDLTKLTSAQVQAHEVSALAVSRQNKALRTARRQGASLKG